MSRHWRWFLPGYLFLLPMSLAALVIYSLVYRAKSWKWYNGVLTCIGGDRIWGHPNAQTLGWVEVYDTEASRQEIDIRVHEAVHIVQGFVGGVVGLIVMPFILGPWWGLALGGLIGGLGFSALYGILFMYFLLTQKAGWYEAYMANPFEKQAYTIQDKYLRDTTKRPWGV